MVTWLIRPKILVLSLYKYIMKLSWTSPYGLQKEFWISCDRFSQLSRIISVEDCRFETIMFIHLFCLLNLYFIDLINHYSRNYLLFQKLTMILKEHSHPSMILTLWSIHLKRESHQQKAHHLHHWKVLIHEQGIVSFAIRSLLTEGNIWEVNNTKVMWPQKISENLMKWLVEKIWKGRFFES